MPEFCAALESSLSDCRLSDILITYAALSKHYGIKLMVILCSTPFHPGYATADVIKKAKNLKLVVTAGVGESSTLTSARQAVH